MAKVSNEVKLILSLAKERCASKAVSLDGEAKLLSQADQDYYRGVKAGMKWYEGVLEDIVQELQRK